jgi:hypothetical protein
MKTPIYIILSTRLARLAVAALGLCTIVAWCQSGNGSVRGTVHDQSRAVIPGAQVTLTHTATNVQSKTSTNGVGSYTFPSVVPGPYRVAVESPGMSKLEVTVTVSVQETAEVDATLVPAGTQTVVKVEDVTPMVTTEDGALGHTLERTRIEELPLNGRNVSLLLDTVPGMLGSGIRTYGVRQGTHDMLLDGAPLTDELNGGFITRQPSLDSIQEFRVVVNAASAKYTRQNSIVLTTKGGTNQLHGSLFETNRNASIGVARARDNITNKAAHYVRNEFGGTVGGPVFLPKLYNGRNRTFWFASYEAFRQRQGNITGFSVPTDGMRNGDFSNVVTATGTRVNIYNPWTTDPVTHARAQFAYGGVPNKIDPALESPLAKYMYGVLPAPNRPDVNPLVAANYYGPAPDHYNQGTLSLRFDHRFSDRDSVYARLSNSHSQRDNASLGVPTLDKTANYVQTLAPNKNLAAHHTRMFSPTFFNELLFSATRTFGAGTTGGIDTRYANQLGLPNPNDQVGFPVIDQIGVGGGLNGNYYFQSVNAYAQRFNYFVLDDHATKIKGRHELQFGMHLRYDQLTYLPQQQQSGGFIGFASIATSVYDPAVTNRSRGMLNTGSIGAAAYLGLANYTYPMLKGTYYIRQHEDAFYFQDNFRVKGRLMLNLGVRWQLTPFAKEKHDIFTGFDLKNMAVVLPDGLDALYRAGVTTPGLIRTLQSYGAKYETAEQAGLPHRLMYNNWHDVGPHVGFAYRVLEGRRSFVLRSGFSLNYHPLPMYIWNDTFRTNMPFRSSFTNSILTVASQSPDGQQNWGLVSVPAIVAGKNSANAIDLSNPSGITVGGTSFREGFFDPHQPTSRVYDWNFTLEKELLRDTVMRLAYVGNHASKQEVLLNLNETIPNYTWLMTNHLPYPVGTWTAAQMRPLDSQTATTLPYGDIQEFVKAGWSDAHGAQVEFERRFSRGVGFQVFYNLMNVSRAGADAYNADSTLSPVTSYLPGAVPADITARMRLLLQQRDVTIPQQQIKWNWVAELPVGRGRPLGRNMHRWLDAVVGGWQLAGMGSWRTNYFSLPTSIWPTGTPVQYYGHKYRIQDCRSGACIPGFLMWNGYIPAHQINSHDAKTGKPNGIMGVPADYKPAEAPLWPYPADYPSRNAQNDPNYGYYGTNTVSIPVSNGTRQEVAYGALHPWIYQPIASTNTWLLNTSLKKTFRLTERVGLRLQVDAFNVFNMPGNSPSANSLGLSYTNTNLNTPRQLQLTGRLNW